MIVVWWSISSSLLSFVGCLNTYWQVSRGKVSCVLVFGGKQNKELPYIPYFLSHFEDLHGWIPVKSLFLPKKGDFPPWFFRVTKNHFYRTGKAKTSNNPSSVFRWRPPFRFRASPTPQTTLETLHSTSSLHGLRRYQLTKNQRHRSNLVPIRCNPRFLKNFWNSPEFCHICVPGLLQDSSLFQSKSLTSTNPFSAFIRHHLKTSVLGRSCLILRTKFRLQLFTSISHPSTPPT